MKNKIINYEMNNWEVPLNKCYDFLSKKTRKHIFNKIEKKSLKFKKFKMSINILKWVKILFNI